jgi:PKD repeat protein
MGYEVGGNLYFRRWDGSNWSDYEQLESSGRWPSITQALDGQAWMLWEDDGSLWMRHYTGSLWEPKSPVLTSTVLFKGYYPNLKLGTSEGLVEWVANACNGAPFRLMVDSMPSGADAPPTVTIADPSESQVVAGTYRVLMSASDDQAVSQVELSIDGGEYVDITGSFDETHYFFDWDTTAHPDGGHTLRARATDDNAQSTESTVVNVTVDNNQSPVATFSFDCTDLACDFNGSASYDLDGTILDYDWDFGDGNIGTGMTMDHAYAAPGTYIVVLTVTDDDGASGEDAQDVSVTEAAAIHVGDLDGTKTSVKNTWTAGVTIAVHDGGHSPVNGAEVVGTWSEGAAGQSGCTTNESGLCEVSYSRIPKKVSSVLFTVNDVSHPAAAYRAAGNHDPDGDSTGTSITVPPPANQLPVAAYTFDCTDLVCDFDAAASYDPDGVIVSYLWDLGDGNDRSGATINHTYTEAGTYGVMLTVTDDGGATDADTQSVPVGGGQVTPTMYVPAIFLEGKAAGPNRSATAIVTIEDTDNNWVEGATVSGSWSGDYAGDVSGVTGPDGTVTFASGKVRQAGAEFTFTVTDVVKAGFIYDEGLNDVTSATIVVG